MGMVLVTVLAEKSDCMAGKGDSGDSMLRKDATYSMLKKRYFLW